MKKPPKKLLTIGPNFFYVLKSIHFKKPDARILFLSKLWYFHYKSKQKVSQFERNEIRANGFLKWTDFSPAAQMAQKQKSRTTKSPLCRTGYLGWVCVVQTNTMEVTHLESRILILNSTGCIIVKWWKLNGSEGSRFKTFYDLWCIGRGYHCTSFKKTGY